MNWSRNSILVASLGSGWFGTIIAIFGNENVFNFFMIGTGTAYLSIEFWSRFWAWEEKQPKFKGFKYWWEIAKENI